MVPCIEQIIDIQISPDQPDQLKVNDLPMYPRRWHFRRRPLRAYQVESDVSLKEFTSSQDKDRYQSLRLGYMAVMEKKVKAAHSSERMQLVYLSLKIISIEDKPVRGLDKVKSTVLKMRDGRLALASAKLEATSPDEDQCNGPVLLCKFRAIVMGGMRKFRIAFHRCHRKMGHHMFGHRHHPHHYHAHGTTHHDKAQHAKPCRQCQGMTHRKPCKHRQGTTHGMPAPPPPHVASDVNGAPLPPVAPHGQASEFHDRHPAMHSFVRVAMHATLLTLIGVVAGMVASALGMLIGHIVVSLWRRFYRSRNGGAYSSVALEEDGSGDFGSDGPADEKPFLDDDSLPAYEAKDAVEVVEKN